MGPTKILLSSDHFWGHIKYIAQWAPIHVDQMCLNRVLEKEHISELPCWMHR